MSGPARTYDSPAQEARNVFATALAFDEPLLLSDHVRWRASIAAARGDRENGAEAILQRLRVHDDALTEPPDGERRKRFLVRTAQLIGDAASGELDRSEANPDARRYLAALLASNNEGALEIVNGALSAGLGLDGVSFRIIEPALIETGILWEKALISPILNRYVIDSTLHIMNVVSSAFPRQTPRPRTFVGMPVEGEQHDMGLRMIHDALRARGWQTVLLPADASMHAFAAVVREHFPAVVGLSVTMAAHLTAARDAIARLRALDRRNRIVVGGRPLQACGDLWRKLGADAGPRNGPEALATIEELGERLAGMPR
jgi:methanogenic corrinoid protein MtbC1